VTWTYDDGNGNSIQQTQTVVVDDVTAPVADQGTLPMVSGECSATIASAPTATDACAGTVTGTTSDPLTYSSQGTYTVTWTYDDGNGNSSTQDQVVAVEDVTAPVLTMNSTPFVLWPANHKYQTVSLAQMLVSVSDNCDNLPTVAITHATSDEAEDASGNGDGNTIDDMVIMSGCQSVKLRAERAGNGNGRVYTVYVRASDASGNWSVQTFKVHVPKNLNAQVIEGVVVYTETGPCYPSKHMVEIPAGKQDGFTLEQNYPNPFNPSTTISYTLREGTRVLLRVFNMYGQEIRKLADRIMPAGAYTVLFDAGDLPSGTYLYRLEADGRQITRTMTLMK